MRTLFVHERLGAFGGAEANLCLTARELKQRGHEVGLLHGAGTGQGEDFWHAIFSPRYPLADGDNCARIQSALWAFEPELIYVHKLADLEALQTLLGSGIPLVRMVHDHDLYCMRSYKYNTFTRRICHRPLSAYCVFPCGAFLARNRRGRLPVRWISYRTKKQELRLNRHCDRLLVATRYMADELIRNGFDPQRIEILPPVTHPGDAAWRSTFSDRNLVLFVGQIIRGKGVDVLLQSLAFLTAPFECLIVGEGNHRPYCEKLCRKLGLADRVRFTGFVPQEELQGFYREASVMVLSSVWPEPFGGAGLEGMRYGLPVVAFDAGGVREWLTDGHNGFLVPWMDRGCFAYRVQQLLTDKTLGRRLGEHGRQFVRQGYTVGKYIDDLEHIFARTLAGTEEQLRAWTGNSHLV